MINMLYYNNSWMRTGTDFSVKCIDDNGGGCGWSSANSHYEVEFTGVIRPSVNMPLVMDIFNNTILDEIDFIPTRFSGNVHMKEFELHMDAKMMLTCDGIVYARKARHVDLDIPRPDQEYFDTNEIATHYSSVLISEGKPVKAKRVSIQLIPYRVLVIESPDELDTSITHYELNFHNLTSSKRLGTLHIDCIYSNVLYRINTLPHGKSHVLFITNLSWESNP